MASTGEKQDKAPARSLFPTAEEERRHGEADGRKAPNPMDQVFGIFSDPFQTKPYLKGRAEGEAEGEKDRVKGKVKEL